MTTTTKRNIYSHPQWLNRALGPELTSRFVSEILRRGMVPKVSARKLVKGMVESWIEGRLEIRSRANPAGRM